MAGPRVGEGVPAVMRLDVADSQADVRRQLSELGVRRAGQIRQLDPSRAMARVEGFFSSPGQFIVTPYVARVSQAALSEAAEREARGGYITGTNIIMISERALRGTYRPEQGERTMVHELVHYAGFLGSGHRMTFRYGGGIREQEMPVWLSEGLTQSFTELIMPSRDAPTYTYDYEVLAAVLLEKIVGLDAVRSAFRSGDFREVQERLDAELGSGTFARLAGEADGARAYIMLYGTAFGLRRGRGPVSEEEFLSDLRVRGAMKAIDLMADPAFRTLADEARSLRERRDAQSQSRMDEIARQIMEMEALS
ncbi:MAG: hypothetical protein AB1324_06985 [Candidatus Micrarchaeota archaeon]